MKEQRFEIGVMIFFIIVIIGIIIYITIVKIPESIEKQTQLDSYIDMEKNKFDCYGITYFYDKCLDVDFCPSCCYKSFFPYIIKECGNMPYEGDR